MSSHGSPPKTRSCATRSLPFRAAPEEKAVLRLVYNGAPVGDRIELKHKEYKPGDGASGVAKSIERATRTVWLNFRVGNEGNRVAKGIKATFKVGPVASVLLDRDVLPIDTLLAPLVAARGRWFEVSTSPLRASADEAAEDQTVAVLQRHSSIPVHDAEGLVRMGLVAAGDPLLKREWTFTMHYRIAAETGENVSGQVLIHVKWEGPPSPLSIPQFQEL
jgi:hypothetical protein